LVLIHEEVLEVKEKRFRNRNIKDFLVKWNNFPIEDVTWEGEQVLQKVGTKLLVGKQFPIGDTVMSPSS
jgi:hypothetical protein